MSEQKFNKSDFNLTVVPGAEPVETGVEIGGRKAVLHYIEQIREMNKTLMEHWLPVWKENAEANRSLWEKGATIGDIIEKPKKYRARCGVVCGAGPSLADSMPAMVEHRKDMTIIAVDAALYPLRLAGIFPDFVFLRNHHEITLELLKGYPTEQSTFIVPITIHPELLKQIKGKVHFYVPVDNIPVLKEWAAGIPERIGRFILKPSSGSMAAIFASLLHFRMLVLAGMDFAFTHNKLYCDLVKYLFDPEFIATHTETQDPWKKPFGTKDIFRDPIYTSYALQMSAEDLFRYFMLNRYEHVYNASGGVLYNMPWLPVRYAVVGISPLARQLRNITVDAGDVAVVRMINEVTNNTFMGLMSRNLIMNKESGRVERFITEMFKLKSEFSKRIAVVAGASPSLDDSLEAMRKHRDKFFLTAVDASLNPLLEAGIKPDIVVSVDPQRSVDEFFINVDTRDIPLVATIVTHPEAIQHWQGPILWGWGLNPHKHFLQLATLFPDMPAILPQGNCGSTAVVLLQCVGFRQIVLTGIDFAFTHDRYYCRNVLKPGVNLNGKDALRANREAGGREVDELVDARGNKVLTDDTFQTYAEVLREKLADDINHGIAHYFNAGAGLITNIPVIDMDDFFENQVIYS